MLSPVCQYFERRRWVWLIFDITSWSLAGVILHIFLLVINPDILILHNKESGASLCFFKTKVRYRQQKPVLMFVLWIFVKKILWSHNPLASFCLRLLKFYTQLAPSGCKDFDQRRWVCLIFVLTLWISAGVSLYKYLLVLDSKFLIQIIVEKTTTKTKS